MQKISPSMQDFLHISVKQVNDHSLRAVMPVNERNCQPYGLLCGGASLALCEICAGMYSEHQLQGTNQVALGIQVTGNHIKSAHIGEQVSCEITPLSCGQTLHVLQARVCNAQGELLCSATITNAIRPNPRHTPES